MTTNEPLAPNKECPKLPAEKERPQVPAQQRRCFGNDSERVAFETR